MKILKCLVIPAVFSLMTACGESSAIKKEVLANLKDPDSAKFGEITVVPMGEKSADGKEMMGACVGVNAKNSMGGYGGEQQANLILANGTWRLGGFSKITHQDCLEVVNNTKK